MSQFKASVTIYGKIECVTGLHIGGSGGGYEIGGIENSVIRNPIDDFPYIPGSSLKGKMRSLMEWALGKIDQRGKVYENSANPDEDEILRIFGASSDKERQSGPTRLFVRDAVPDAQTKDMMQQLESEQGLPKVEVKTEVSINRITSKSDSGPRQIERVPVGSKFDFELVYGIYDIDGLKVHDIDLLDRVFFALRLVEDSALGGSGSRGYGQVRFHLSKPLIKTVMDYQSGASIQKSQGGASGIDDLTPLNRFSRDEIHTLKEELRAQIRQSPGSRAERKIESPVEVQTEQEPEEQSQ